MDDTALVEDHRQNDLVIDSRPLTRGVRRIMLTNVLVIFVANMLIALALFVACAGGGSTTSSPKWYEGGTLHKKSALEWQTASNRDKLATCADFVTAMWQEGHLKPSIANRLSTVDDVRPYAEQLMAYLDAAFKPDPDPQLNRKMFTNQTVVDVALIGMVMLGWVK